MKALISSKEDGRIVDIRKDNEIFNVHPDLFWVDCDENVQKESHTYNLETKQIEEYLIPSDPEERFLIARQIAYGEIGQQLDMIYHELNVKGTIDTSGEWFNHVKTVKDSIRKDEI